MFSVAFWAAVLQNSGEFAKGVQRAEKIAANNILINKREPVQDISAVMRAGKGEIVGRYRDKVKQ